MSLGSITSTTHGETDLWPGQLFAPAVGPLFTTSHPSHPYYHHRTQRSWSQPSSAPVRGQLLAPARSASLPRASLRLLPSADRSGQYQEHAAECSRLPHRRQRSSNESTAQSCPLFDKLPVEVLRDISSFVQASGSSTTWLRVHPMLLAVGQPLLLRHIKIKSVASLRALLETLDASPAYFYTAGYYVRSLSIECPVIPAHLVRDLVAKLASAQQSARADALNTYPRLNLSRLKLSFPASETSCPTVAQILWIVSPQRLEWLSSPCWSVSLDKLSECLRDLPCLKSLTLGGFLVDERMVQELNRLAHLSELHLLGWKGSNTNSIHPAVLQALLAPSLTGPIPLERVSLAGCSAAHAAVLSESVKKTPSPYTPFPLYPKSSRPWASQLSEDETMIISRVTDY